MSAYHSVGVFLRPAADTWPRPLQWLSCAAFFKYAGSEGAEFGDTFSVMAQSQREANSLRA